MRVNILILCSMRGKAYPIERFMNHHCIGWRVSCGWSMIQSNRLIIIRWILGSGASSESGSRIIIEITVLVLLLIERYKCAVFVYLMSSWSVPEWEFSIHRHWVHSAAFVDCRACHSLQPASNLIVNLFVRGLKFANIFHSWDRWRALIILIMWRWDILCKACEISNSWLLSLVHLPSLVGGIWLQKALFGGSFASFKNSGIVLVGEIFFVAGCFSASLLDIFMVFIFLVKAIEALVFPESFDVLGSHILVLARIVLH